MPDEFKYGVTYLDDPTLYTVFYDELDGLDRSVLAKPVNAVHGFCGSISKPRNCITGDWVCSRYSTAGFHQLSMR